MTSLKDAKIERQFFFILKYCSLLFMLSWVGGHKNYIKLSKVIFFHVSVSSFKAVDAYFDKLDSL